MYQEKRYIRSRLSTWCILIQEIVPETILLVLVEEISVKLEEHYNSGTLDAELLTDIFTANLQDK